MSGGSRENVLGNAVDLVLSAAQIGNEAGDLGRGRPRRGVQSHVGRKQPQCKGEDPNDGCGR